MRSARIAAITAREILDSRGLPTLEVVVTSSEGVVSWASVPSGASRGRTEATEMRDGGERYQGSGVLGACRTVNETIGPLLAGVLVNDQEQIDAALCEADGTPDKSKLGGNAVVGVSLACSRVGAASAGVPL